MVHLARLPVVDAQDVDARSVAGETALLSRILARVLTEQPYDLWHPHYAYDEFPDWPTDWPESFRAV